MSWFKKEEENFSDWTTLKTTDGLVYYYNTKTKVTTWDKPAELTTDDDEEELVWCPNPSTVFSLSRVKKRADKKIFLETVDTGEELVVKEGTVLDKVKKSHLERFTPDLVLLDNMSDPLILHNLKSRFVTDNIYTSIGTILISINPYKWLDLYSPKVVRSYEKKLRNYEDVSPHVFVIADNSYKGLTFVAGKSQSIIISGESGAGKTECTKQCLQYLSAVAGSVSGVEDKVLKSNPILEAFGNAKTVRNNNSSRFGKFIEIFFTDKYEICSAFTSNYLLEKIRVVRQMAGERNFHFFYMLCVSPIAAKYQLHTPDKHHYTNQSEIVVEGLDDKKLFEEVDAAFKTMNISDKDKNELYEIVAGILHLGDVKFNVIGEKKCAVNNRKVLELAAQILKLDKKKLEFCLMNRNLKMKGESNVIHVGFSKDECIHARDALAKFIYGYLFDWIVRRINESLKTNVQASPKTIGILDIFGFEIFKENSFEQLCINYTNEKLQQNFNKNIFKLEEMIYREEKIDFKHIPFVDNQPILDLIEKGNNCILKSLDEEVKMPKGNDGTYLSKLVASHSKNEYFKKDVKQDKNCFTMVHYAGPVTYDTRGFVEKSRDTLSEDLVDLVNTSEIPLMKILLPKDSSENRKRTLGYMFCQQVNSLMDKINLTEPHYIRCVKPNRNKRPREFDPKMCHEQLTYSGVFEAVKIRKSGFPFRLKHGNFMERYRCILNVPDKEGGTKEDCVKLIKNPKFNFNESNIQIGKSMVFYRADEHRVLELLRSIEIEKRTLDQRLKEILAEAPDKYDPSKEEFFERFYKIVTRANELKFESPTADKARKQLDIFIETRMDPETKKILVECLKNPELEKIEKILDVCEERMYETENVRKVKELYEKIVEVTEALKIATSKVSRVMLQNALESAKEYNLKSDVFNNAKTLFEKITQIENDMETGINNVDEFSLSKSIGEAQSINLEDEVTMRATDLYDKIVRINAELDNARNCVVEQNMKIACDKAEELRLNSTQYQQCKKLYQTVVQIHSDEVIATNERDSEKMTTIIDRAYAIGLNSPQIQHCVLMRDRINRIREEEALADHNLCETHMRSVIKAADEIGFETETTNKFKDLLALSKEEFIKHQIKKAAAIKDSLRYIWLEIELRTLIYEKYENMFDIDKFGKLYHPEEWASKKMFSMKKNEIQSLFLKFQSNGIHSPLTQFPKTEDRKAKIKKAKNFFLTIQAYMGDYTKAQKDPNTLVYEMLQECCSDSTYRNEVYIQVIKQLTYNARQESVNRGWDLLKIMTSTFPPDESFEIFLEKYYRTYAKNPEVMVALLHKTIFESKGAYYAPDISKFREIIDNNSTSGFTENLPENPSWADLDDSYLAHAPPEVASYLKVPYTPQSSGAGQPAAAPEAVPNTNVWSKHFDNDSGYYFYVNNETGESTWDKPSDFVET